MKIALLADIHGNLPALREVLDDVDRWDPDRVYVAGDVINRGPRSAACLDIILNRCQADNWHLIRGNHELYVLDFDQPDSLAEDPPYRVLGFVHWTHQRLAKKQLQILRTLPEEIKAPLPQGQQLQVVHASPAGIRQGIYPETPPDEIAQLIGSAPDLLLVGHTHRPLIRSCKNTQIINPGAVGLPFDGDRRAAYAQIIEQEGEREARIIRLDYAYSEAVKDFFRTGFIPQGGPLAELILTELRTARPLISRWNRRCFQAVLEGKISLEDSVHRFLQDCEEGLTEDPTAHD